MKGLFDIEGKVAWVTGASAGGLGYYHALTLGEAGANVVVSDLSSRATDLDETKNNLQRRGVKVLALHIDVSKEDEVRNAVSTIEKEFAGIDILVNNAAVSVEEPSLEMQLTDWDRVISVNLTGLWLCSRTACQLMVRKKIKGKIVQIASTHGLQVGSDLEPSAPYYATKAAVINLTRALAVEWAPYGINVNAIAPGYFRTRMNRFVDENPELKRRFLSRIPLKRAGDSTKDLAGALIYLSSSASDYVTGHTLVVDGERTAHN
jgi:NAD(P)-dependent dehydrogenase (short-subunit alcohol dehydrogenase family)